MASINAMRYGSNELVAVLIDDALVEGLVRHNWRVDAKGYVRCSMRGSRRRWLISRLVMGIDDPAVLVDHINGDPLDNRRCNLRLCNYSQNAANKRRLTTNTSGFKGVTLHRRTGKWQAQLVKDGRSHYLGLYDDAESAGRAYAEAAQRLHGRFAFAPHFDIQQRSEGVP